MQMSGLRCSWIVKNSFCADNLRQQSVQGQDKPHESVFALNKRRGGLIYASMQWNHKSRLMQIEWARKSACFGALPIKASIPLRSANHRQKPLRRRKITSIFMSRNESNLHVSPFMIYLWWWLRADFIAQLVSRLDNWWLASGSWPYAEVLSTGEHW